MATFTKQAICASYMKLLKERSLDQISVKDIVEDCGVNRKTFYYYFQDIYALTDELLKSELERVKSTLPANAGWKDAQKALVRYMLANKTAILHVYRSMDYERIEQTAFDIAMNSLPQMIRQYEESANIKDEDVLLISQICSSAIAGFIARWVRDGMKNDPEELIDRVDAIMTGTARLGIANASALS